MFPEPALTALDLARAVRRSKKAIIELRWFAKELLAFQTLATKWHNTLCADWMDGDIPTDFATLVRVGQGLVDWGDETTKLVSQLRSKRKTDWAKFVTEPFQQRHLVSGMLYWFGCPSTSEEPDGLCGMCPPMHLDVAY